MHVVEHVDADTIGNIVQKDITENQTIKTDGWRAYGAVKSKGHGLHNKAGMTSKEVKEFLGWVHTLASNAKSFLLGTLHGIGKKHLQEYLDEFCYRFNRRNWEAQIFERLVTACVHSKGVTYSELIQ